MIRFAPQATRSTSTPPRAPEAAAASLERKGADATAASLLLIPELEEPVVASASKAKSRGAKKPKAVAIEPSVQLDLAT